MDLDGLWIGAVFSSLLYWQEGVQKIEIRMVLFDRRSSASIAISICHTFATTTVLEFLRRGRKEKLLLFLPTYSRHTFTVNASNFPFAATPSYTHRLRYYRPAIEENFSAGSFSLTIVYKLLTIFPQHCTCK